MQRQKEITELLERSTNTEAEEDPPESARAERQMVAAKLAGGGVQQTALPTILQPHFLIASQFLWAQHKSCGF